MDVWPTIPGCAVPREVHTKGDPSAPRFRVAGGLGPDFPVDTAKAVWHQEAYWLAGVRFSHQAWCDCGDFREHLRRWLATSVGGGGDGEVGAVGEATTDGGATTAVEDTDADG